MKKLIAIVAVAAFIGCGETSKTETTSGASDSTSASTSTETTTGTSNSTTPDSTKMYDQQLSDTNSVSRDSLK